MKGYIMAMRKVESRQAVDFQSFKVGPLHYKRDGSPEARESQVKVDPLIRKLDAIAHAPSKPLGFSVRIRRKGVRFY